MIEKWLSVIKQGRIDNNKKEEARGLTIQGEEIWIPTESGQIRALYYPASCKNAPIYINIHGGGFVYGAPEYEDPYCAYMNRKLNIAVFNVEYRLAPEYPFPAGLNDVYEASLAIVRNRENYPVDTSRVIIGGDSAGANLTIGVCYLLKEREQIRPVAEILNYPGVDNVKPPEEKFFTDGVIPIERQKMYNECYTMNDEDRKNPLCSPIYYTQDQLSGMPDTLLLTCEIDCLRDEGEEFALKLIRSGCEVTCRRMLKTVHGFLMQDTEEALNGMEYVADYMCRKLMC